MMQNRHNDIKIYHIHDGTRQVNGELRLIETEKISDLLFDHGQILKIAENFYSEP